MTNNEKLIPTKTNNTERLTKKRRTINKRKTQQNRNILRMYVYLFILAGLGILNQYFKSRNQYQRETHQQQNTNTNDHNDVSNRMM